MTPEQKKRFKYWQTRTIIATMVGYALFYFVRKNFSLAMPGLEADLGISKTSLGIFLTLNGVVYGLSRFVNGVLGSIARMGDLPEVPESEDAPDVDEPEATDE